MDLALSQEASTSEPTTNTTPRPEIYRSYENLDIHTTYSEPLRSYSGYVSYPYSENCTFISPDYTGPKPKLVIETASCQTPCGLIINGRRIAADNLYILAEDLDSIVISVRIDKSKVSIEKRVTDKKVKPSKEEPVSRRIDI
jgi:hypothetical protein